MKESKKYTGYLLVQAQCNNEYTTCNSCVVAVTPETLEVWKERAVRVKGLSDDTEDLIGVEWMYSGVQFLTLDAEEKGIDTPCWVKITEKDREKYRVEDKVNGASMHITGRGTVWFQGYGKHSGDEYSTTDDVVVDQLTNQ